MREGTRKRANARELPQTTSAGGGLYLCSDWENDGTIGEREVVCTIQNCMISNNYAQAMGGGVAISGAGTVLLLDTSAVIANAARGLAQSRLGGFAIRAYAHANVRDCTFVRNEGQQIGAPAGVGLTGTRISVLRSHIEGGFLRGFIERVVETDTMSLSDFRESAPPGP